MPANLLQHRLIERYAARRSMDVEAAARVWIARYAVAFRAWYNRHRSAK